MDFFDALFPGNLSVAEKLYAAIDGSGVVGFTGAGTSMPSMPSWGTLTANLINNAKESGLMEQAVAASLLSDQSDPLYAIDEVYAAAGESQTKAKVAEIFRSLKNATEVHKFLMGSKIKKFITLNYDLGLEIAFSELYSKHLSSITFKASQEFSAWVSRPNEGEFPPVMHWHGTAGDADSIILSGSDYSKFYNSSVDNRETLRVLFRTERCLLVGFGFTDPFIVSQLNAVMQPLPSENRHFAIIGVKASPEFNCLLERRKFQAKFKSEVIFYNIYSDDTDPHRDLHSILSEINRKKPRDRSPVTAFKDVVMVNDISVGGNKGTTDLISYRSGLFEIDGRVVYCEPKLWLGESASRNQIWTSTISTSKNNYIISAPHEYGLTTLGKRMASEIAISGSAVTMRDAEDIPNYRRKLLIDSTLVSMGVTEKSTIIIDNFSFIEHRRMLKEFSSTFPSIRIVVLARSSPSDDLLSEGFTEINFERVSLAGLSRSDIRDVVRVLAPSGNADMCSGAVERIYDDLLQLCIPLTPSNVIMYASVLCKNGDFTPVSRLHIVERFVSDALQRASDAFSESFSYINKVELFSEFCYSLFESGRIDFEMSEWHSFCVTYKTIHLVDFNDADILADLLGGRVVTKNGVRCSFKYRMFFSYFVGRKIASDPLLLDACIDADRHFELDGLIDVLCASVPNCDKILLNVEKKLTDSLAKFYENYPIAGVNVHRGRKWDIGSNEESVWETVSQRIEDGPASTAELDELKTSVLAERRTIDQKVSIIKFITSEKTVSRAGIILRSALENARGISADVKISSIDTVIRSYALAYEVATIFAPLIAERKYVSWNGFTYINLIENDSSGTPDEEKERMISLVFNSLPTSMGRNIADHFGSRKLGTAFLELLKRKHEGEIYNLLGLALLLRSKPNGWLDFAKDTLSHLKKDDIFLYFALSLTMHQLRNETNTASEVRNLKEFVAAIRLRRHNNLKLPSKSAIEKELRYLDQKDIFKDGLERNE